MKTRIGLAVAAAAILSTGAASARDQIRIVGSSTVFPFATSVAEQFGKKSSFPTPVIESTGSGGGAKLFCAGVGEEHPDITNSSRRMKKKEFDLCQENGVTDIVEIIIGFDGIVVGNAINAASFDISRKDLFKALNAEVPQDGSLAANTYTTWNEVNLALPAQSIEVIGPPPTSGTRDAFEELALEEGMEEAGVETKIEVREDGPYIEAGENDNLIVSKLEANPDALGVFGFSFLDQNSDRIKGASIEGVEPTFENIASGAYPVSRSLFFYVKKAHIGVVPGIEEYLAEFLSEAAIGEDGYAVEKGLIPLEPEARQKFIDAAENLTTLTADDF